MWFQNSEKPPKITEWMPIPSIDKLCKDNSIGKWKPSKKELKEMGLLMEEYK